MFGGAAAVVEIARRIWWAWPLWALSRLPGAMRPMHATYRWIASRRSCANGACTIDAAASLWPVGFLPLLILPVIALLVAPSMPRWGFMWAMAFALYAGCKWLTYREARVRGVASNRLRALGYLLAWPGMDATAFLSGTDRPAQPHPSEWIAAALKTLLGATLIWVVARTAVPVNPLLAGWIGMVGLIFVSALRHVSSAVARLAEHRRERHARHAESAALELAGGILGTTMEHGVSRARDPVHVPALATNCRPGGCHAAGVSGVGLDSRAGDLDTRTRRLRAPHRIFRAPGTGSRRRAHATAGDGSDSDVAGAAGCSRSSSPPPRRSGCFLRCSFETSSCRCSRSSGPL